MKKLNEFCKFYVLFFKKMHSEVKVSEYWFAYKLKSVGGRYIPVKKYFLILEIFY